MRFIFVVITAFHLNVARNVVLVFLSRFTGASNAAGRAGACLETRQRGQHVHNLCSCLHTDEPQASLSGVWVGESCISQNAKILCYMMMMMLILKVKPTIW